MKIKRRDLLENVGFDMTPMIDCVFQLIIFFMLTTDFANTQMERVMLPKASEADEDKNPDKKRLMVNLVHEPPKGVICKELKYDYKTNDLTNPCTIVEHWKVKVGGKPFDFDHLWQYLDNEGDKKRLPSTDGGKSKGLSEVSLMIRADAGAVYKVLELVFNACARAKIWKIEIGAAKPPKK
jgi:hypothetical protein